MPSCFHGTILISACLLGINCRYDGKAEPRLELVADLKGACLVPVCPEQLGGLATPREAARIEVGDGIDVLEGKARVITVKGHDVTHPFIRGAQQTLKLAKSCKAEFCLLKARSPSCGISLTLGVTAAQLLINGFRIEEIC